MLYALSLVGLGVLAVVALLLVFFRGRRKAVPCGVCGSASRFGYSKQAESDRKDILPLCLKCLLVKLGDDYKMCDSRALVIEPAANLPCYVFQPASKWDNCRLGEETTALLSKMQGVCRHCDHQAKFLWTTSKGLLGSNVETVFAEGISQTLLRWGNPEPYKVCAECCVTLIGRALESQNLSFLEVCGPRSEDGFVIAMGY